MSWKRKLRQKIINLGIATYFATWFLEPFYFNVIGVALSRYWSIDTATIHDLLKRFVPFGDWKFVVKERFRPLPFDLLWFFLTETRRIRLVGAKGNFYSWKTQLVGYTMSRCWGAEVRFGDKAELHIIYHLGLLHAGFWARMSLSND